MKIRSAILLAATAVLVGTLAFSSTAFAYTTKTSSCTGCHGSAADTVVTVAQTANDGVNATYSVTVASTGGGLVGWAVLNGSANVANSSGSTGSFTVPVGKTYTVWGNDTNSGANSITISPTAPASPPPPPPPVVTPPPPTPDPTVGDQDEHDGDHSDANGTGHQDSTEARNHRRHHSSSSNDFARWAESEFARILGQSTRSGH
jgi:hypothetical protein